MILGISAYYHDSAAALVGEDGILAAAQEERFTRFKHDSNFPIHAVKYCLEEANLKLEDLDQVVFYEKPFLKFDRLLETYVGFAPVGLHSFVKAMPQWLKQNYTCLGRSANNCLANGINPLSLPPITNRMQQVLFSPAHSRRQRFLHWTEWANGTLPQ